MAHTGFPNSYYVDSAIELEPYPSLAESISCDVAVIGGGYTGVSTALNLAEKGYDVVLLEAERIGWGASGRNGGQASGEPRHDQDDLEERFGKTIARQHWDLNWAALDYLKSCIGKYQINCDWQDGILHAAHKHKYVAEYSAYCERLASEYNCDFMRFVSPQEMGERVGSDSFYGGMLDTRSGHLHPLNFIRGLARAASRAGVRIFEQSRVKVYGHTIPSLIQAGAGQVTAKFIVLGCNGYLEDLEPRLAAKIMPINNFMLATEPLSEELAAELILDNTAVFDTRFVVNYWRLSADRRLLFGGGENYTNRFPADIKQFVRKHMLNIYPQLHHVAIDYGWGGALSITMNRLPHFGRLQPNIYFAQGYSGHGVVLATFAGKLLAEAISGSEERFDLLASIKIPSFPGGTLLRRPGLVAGMLWYSLMDRI